MTERELVASLEAASRPERAAGERAYLKSSLVHLGVPVPVVRAVVQAELRRAGDPADHDAAVALVEALWSASVHERRLAAIEVLSARRDVLSTRDLGLLERMLRDARTWALVDPLSVEVVGSLVLRDPDDRDLVRTLSRWAVDDDFWLRRAALLSQLRRMRDPDANAADLALFAAWADGMLEETEFFVRKAIGWVLRETAVRHPEIVVAYVQPRVSRLSGVTWREAVRRLPPDAAAELETVRRAR